LSEEIRKRKEPNRILIGIFGVLRMVGRVNPETTLSLLPS
jgi:hypothetical protein